MDEKDIEKSIDRLSRKIKKLDLWENIALTISTGGEVQANLQHVDSNGFDTEYFVKISSLEILYFVDQLIVDKVLTVEDLELTTYDGETKHICGNCLDQCL